MKKLVYISGEDFFDVDFPVLKELNKSFDLVWIPILRVNSWYSLEDIHRYCTAHNIKSVPVVQKHKYKDPRMVPFYLKLQALIKRQQPDIVYFEYFGVPLLHVLTPLYHKKHKVVFAIHDVKQHYKMDYGKMKTIYFDYILKRFKNFQVFSDSQLALFRERFPEKNVFMANLYLKDFGPGKLKPRPGKKINFLFFGIIRKNKGIDLILRAFNEIAKYRNDFTVTIAGNTKDWDEYAKNIEDPSIFNLIIRKIKNEEIPDLMVNADYILLPYLDVTQSGVLLTAYNYNLPAIATDFPGFREYIEDGRNGYLIKPTVDSLRNCIEKVLNQDTQQHEAIRHNLEGFIQQHIDIRDITKKYTDYFSSLKSENQQ